MGQRLSKKDRRAQLLDVARSLVRVQGASRLTLGALAERAGVSRPVAYDHFGTREGLLMALYEDIASRQFVAFQQAVNSATPNLKGMSKAIAAADINCYVDTDLEAPPIAAALMGYPELQVFQRLHAKRYARACSVALAPHCDVSEDERELLCQAFIGAGASIADLIAQEGLDKEKAIKVQASIIIRCLSNPDHGGPDQ